MTRAASKCLVKAGDILAIPLFVSSKDALTRFKKEEIRRPRAKFAFARVIEDRRGSGIIIEVFDVEGSLDSSLGDVINHPRLFRPTTTTDLPIAKKRWLPWGNHSDYDRERDSAYSKIELALSVHSSPVLWRGGVKSPITVTEAKKLEEWVCHDPDVIEKRIIAAFKHAAQRR